MKKLVYVIILLGAFFLTDLSVALAQESPSGYNPNSIRPVHQDYMMYKRRVWRRMDLREKQNKPFFAKGNEITKIIIDAVKDGRLYPYKSDSLTERMSKEQFLENLQTPDSEVALSEEEKEMGFGQDTGSGWGEDNGGGGAWGDSNQSAGPAVTYFLPMEVTLMNIVEDVYFDRIRSRQYYDIQSIELVLPPDKIPTGLERKVGTFRYKDVAELFRNMPDEAIWFNPQNGAQHRNLADAFLLRLFNSRIFKVSNTEDLQIVDIYGGDPKKGLYASQEMEHKLMEYEHDLWEF
ncbi:MAG: gliding motility protein GldN [Candidatus Cyclobacteriaceae bacterium M3_2C_046]